MTDIIIRTKDLTKAELIAAIPSEHLSRDDARTKESIRLMISTLPLDIQARLLHLASNKAEAKKAKATSSKTVEKMSLKRKRDNEMRAQRRQAQRVEVSADEDQIVTDLSKFMDLPSAEERREAQSAFRERTSNAGLKMAVCISCAREMDHCDGEQLRISAIPHRSKLIPSKPHPAHDTWEDMLLVTEFIEGAGDEASGWVCNDCRRALELDRRPALALSNKMWIGNIPDELKALTIPEQLLIAVHYPRCFVFKLYPKQKGPQDPETLQRGMRGNVSSFELNTDDLSKMIDGRLLPQKPQILAAVLAVAFIGQGPLPLRWLKSTFRVRRSYIRRALLWLKAHNSHYRNIQIDEDRLTGLPEDAIPDAITATMRQDEDETIPQKEKDGYVPEDEEDESGNGLAKDSKGDIEFPESFGLDFDDINEEGIAGTKTDGTAEVVPLQYLGICDTDLSKSSSHELMLHALANLDNGPGREGGYGVRHSQRAVNDFGRPRESASEEDKSRVREANPMTCAFPLLFPYAEGGIEADREVLVGFLEHVRWAMQYYDRRFRTHHSFPFVAFAQEQKRQALRSVKAHMSRRDFERDSHLLTKVTAADLKLAEEEEKKGVPFSNEGVRVLRKHVRAMGGKVIGSDHSRAAYRPQIWGTTIMHNPPSIWATINPVDVHDPVAQVFAGENINMDDFNTLAGPDKDDRARNIAHDPYAAAKFFKFIITAVLECLFNINTSGHRVRSGMGILGEVTAYFGVVEAQGRGTLHLHMIIWLKNAPTTEEMDKALLEDAFRQKIAAYIKANIRAHLDGFTKEGIKEIARESELAYSRPPSTKDEDYEEQVLVRERAVVRSQQVHTCKKETCLRLDARTGTRVCKRRAPFLLSEEDVIKTDGRWMTKRTYGYLNNWCPDIVQALACNNDMKLLTNGKETKDCAWYCTCYSTKKQSKTHNMSALLANGIAYHGLNLSYLDDILNQNRLMLFRCFQALNREAEYSGPQVIMYLMGWGDHFASHKYTAIYWSSMTSAIRREFPSIQKVKANGQGDVAKAINGVAIDQPAANVSAAHIDGQEEVVLSFDPQGRLAPRSQLQDYMLRGPDLKSFSFLSFLMDTYEVFISRDKKNREKDSSKGDDISEEMDPKEPEEEQTHPSKRGRKPNARYKYDACHPRSKTHQRMARTAGHKYLPSFVGPYFPRSDDEDDHEYYCCNALALLKPWYALSDLRNEGEAWDGSLQRFLGSASAQVRRILSNIQYYYHCNNSAQKDSEDRAAGSRDAPQRPRGGAREEDDDDDLGEDTSAEVTVTEEIIEELEAVESAPREARHGRTAVEIARFAKIFAPSGCSEWKIEGRDAGPASGDDLAKMETWRAELDRNVKTLNGTTDDDVTHETNSMTSIMAGASITQDQNTSEMQGRTPTKAPGITCLPSEANETSTLGQANYGQSELRLEQRRAFDIVKDHLERQIAGESVPQLLMQIHGEGGTGKSKVIRTITKAFEGLGVGQTLARSAYTGIAASIIDGKTLHTLVAIPLNGQMPSAKAIEKVAEATKRLLYLIIDEMSMISRAFLAKLSRIFDMISASRGLLNTAHKPFGGLHVILVGDLHQFPPVAGGRSAPLYWPGNVKFDTDDKLIGRKIFECFTTVVILREQMRVVDPEWLDFLRHARTGSCQPHHLKMLRSLILAEELCPPTNFEDGPWSGAVLVTPRHAVRLQWNAEAMRKHCRKTHQTLYRCRAEDTVKGRKLTIEERFCVAKKMAGIGGADSRREMSKLPLIVEFAKGMEVMVTFNVETDLDVANGSRGRIHSVVLDEDEVEKPIEATEVLLEFVPAYLLIEMDRTKASSLSGLPGGVIPLEPLTRSFTIKLKSGRQVTFKRRQLPLTAAYAFTDYRSQGQTIPYVIVDIGNPPSGGLTPFHAYVALSRSSGRDTIRLLRDFNDSLFTTIPCPMLEVEDRRIESLDAETKKWWDEGGEWEQE